MQRIGIYPGTFDPIHNGHLAFALEATKQCRLDKVILLPEQLPRSKHNVTPVLERVQQIKAAALHHPSVDVQLLSSSQFTVRTTLAEIQKRFEHKKLTLLVGSDVALGLHKWNGIEMLIATCDVAVGLRSNETVEDVQRQFEKLSAMCPTTNFTIITTNYSSLSSSSFRGK